MKFLAVRAIPAVSWSSSHPHNLKPAPLTLCYLLFGLAVFGLGEAFIIAAGVGVSPWTVFAQGLGIQFGLSIGWATFAVSVAVLLAWIPLRQIPGIGTLANAIVVAMVIEISLPYLPKPEVYPWQILQALAGVLTVGIGSGFYLTAGLGAGPRDGLMTGLQRLTGHPVAWVRTSLEIAVVTLGWLLGGSVGIGTLLFAVGIGPAVSCSLYGVKLLFERNDGNPVS